MPKAAFRLGAEGLTVPLWCMATVCPHLARCLSPGPWISHVLVTAPPRPALQPLWLSLAWGFWGPLFWHPLSHCERGLCLGVGQGQKGGFPDCHPGQDCSRLLGASSALPSVVIRAASGCDELCQLSAPLTWQRQRGDPRA